EHDRDLQAGRQPHYFARTGDGVHAAGIGDDGDAAFAHGFGETCYQRRKVTRIAEVWIGLLLFLQDRHGDLGQVIEREVIDRALLDKADRGFEPIAPEALAVGDADHL